jgi:hypothetical protein
VTGSLLLLHGAGSGPWAFDGWTECPMVVYGDEFRDERGSAIVALYGSVGRHFPGFTHWDLVRRPEVRDAVARWLAA